MPLHRFFEGNLGARFLFLHGRPGTSKTSMLLQTIAHLPSIEPGQVIWSAGGGGSFDLRSIAERAGLVRRCKGLTICTQATIEFMYGYALASGAKLIVLDHFGARERELLTSLELRRKDADKDDSKVPMIVVAASRIWRRLSHRSDVHLEVSRLPARESPKPTVRVDVHKNRFGDVDPIVLRVTRRGVRAAA